MIEPFGDDLSYLGFLECLEERELSLTLGNITLNLSKLRI